MRYLLLLLSLSCCLSFAENRFADIDKARDEAAAECDSDDDCRRIFKEMQERKERDSHKEPMLSMWDLLFIFGCATLIYKVRSKRSSSGELHIETRSTPPKKVTDDEIAQHEKLLRDLDSKLK